jgi:hypothetical protein
VLEWGAVFPLEQEIRLLRFKHPAQSAQPLQVGVVHAGDHPAPWISDLLGLLKRIPGIELQVFATAKHVSKPRRPAWLVDRLYSMSRSKYDPFGELAIDRSGSVAPEFFDALRAARCGLIVWLAGRPASGIGLRGLAEHGVLTVQLGDRDRGVPFWDEVANCAATTATTILWHDGSFTQGRAVRKAETPTAPGLFVTENAGPPVAAAIRMLADLCLEIQHGGAQFFGQVRGSTPLLLDSDARCPSNFEAARFIVKKSVRSAYRRSKTRGKTLSWSIALRPNRGESLTDSAPPNLEGFKWVPVPKGMQEMADPFPVEVGGREYLLFEEVPAGTLRGRLGCVEVLADGSCSDRKIFLERDYHVSYPCVVPLNGDLFLLPETFEAGRVDLYRFRRFPDELEVVSSLAEGLQLVDTTPVFLEDRWYFFTTTVDPFMETLLLSAERLEGPWSLHPCNPVSTSARSCRSAGHLFWRNGRLFRPTQDCSVRYGYAIAINEVTKLTPTEFEEHPAGYLPPSWAAGLLGTHTWNESSQWQAVDGLRLASRQTPLSIPL